MNLALYTKKLLLIFRFFIFLLFFGFCATNITAQTRIIYFKDKANSPFSLQRPQEFLTQKSISRRTKQNIAITQQDLPVNPAYLTSVSQAGARIIYPMRWLNACVAVCSDALWNNTLSKLPFVSNGQQISAATKIDDNNDNNNNNKDIAQANPNNILYPLYPQMNNIANGRIEGEESYGNSLTQVKMLGIDEMHKANFTGKGITIAVFDAGFPNVDTNKNSVYSKMTILGTYDFVASSPFVYGYSSHGANVLSVLAAYKPNEAIGTAFESSYYLFRTENDDRQLDDRIEECNWLAAAERADSLGVDIINSSLGYNYFKNPIYSYKQTDLNGKTALVSQAATIAAHKGMLVVSSAGNLFEPEWTKIKMPADADSIIAVGSVNAEGIWLTNSLQGNTTDNRVKPEVAAMGSGTVGVAFNGTTTTFSGTSFAAPLITGLAAGLWQANPQMTAMQIRQAILRAGSRFFSPNTQLGYGIPQYGRAMSILGIDNSTDEKLLQNYPNPLNYRTENLQLRFDSQFLEEKCQFILTDITGKEVFKTTFIISETITQIPLQSINISAGTYFLRLESKKIKATRKIVLQ
jgi:serine protease AprX